MSEQLKPCPFCGSPAEMYPDGDDEGHQVMCSSGVSSCHMNTFGHQTVDEAVAAWNTRALTQRPAAQTERGDDDGDVTGQPGPLPETGWDEVPENAFRKPSPTAGMNLGERIKHVGGRENAAGYIEFGSVMAVRALVRQYLRDLPAPQQATPEPVGEVYGWAVTGLSFIWRGEHAQACAEQEAKTCGGTSTAFPLFTRPAPGVPEDVRIALEFYAGGNHFVRADADAWETVSGEPPNFWEDEANTATVEDGTIARNALAALAAAQAKGGV